MPVVSVSLSEVGYEGYKELPKGRRSRYIDRMLRDYALDHHHVKGRSVREIGEMQVNLKAMIESLQQENKKLKEQLPEEEKSLIAKQNELLKEMGR